MSKSFWSYAAAAVYVYLNWQTFGLSNFFVAASFVAGGADRGGYRERAAAKRAIQEHRQSTAGTADNND